MKTDAERQNAYQERQREAGLVRLHCWTTPDTRQALREIAEREGKAVGEVLELGMLLARQHLKTAHTTAPARGRPTVVIAKPTSAPPSAFAPTSDTDTSPTPAEPPESLSSSPEHPGDNDARIRLAAADAWRLEQ